MNEEKLKSLMVDLAIMARAIEGKSEDLQFQIGAIRDMIKDMEKDETMKEIESAKKTWLVT
jgi:hypothetical protein